MDEKTSNRLLERVRNLHQLSKEFARETNRKKLLEVILLSMQRITHSDGGILYTMAEDKSKLKFEVLNNFGLEIKMGGTSQTPVPFNDIPFYDGDGVPNLHHMVCHVVLKDETLNFQDVYSVQDFDITKIRKFDKLTKYRTKSVLVLPIKDHHNEIIGVIQLSNAMNEKGEVVNFSKEDDIFTNFLGSWAGMMLTTLDLNDDLKKLFESIVQVLASAVDDKSPYTGGHCRRVPVLAMMIADALQKVDYGPLESFKLSSAERYELELAALLHDCGKVTTPVHIMDKATKLETIFDRIELIDYRFEILLRDEEIESLKRKIKVLEGGKGVVAVSSGNGKVTGMAEKKQSKEFQEIDAELEKKRAAIIEDRDFLRRSNIGGEVMPLELKNKVKQIGSKYRWKNPDGVTARFLGHDEIKNLTLSRGTLTPEEREIINHHAEMTWKMLSQMHFPPHLRRIPEIASCHHEKINGHGYPRGLRGEEMSVQARLMGVADIFEALTAKDRPYKKGKTLTESLTLMGQMKLDMHIDGDIFDVFMDKKIYLDYAKKYLDDYQIDDVDLNKIPGYLPPEKRYGTFSSFGNEEADKQNEGGKEKAENEEFRDFNQRQRVA